VSVENYSRAAICLVALLLSGCRDSAEPVDDSEPKSAISNAFSDQYQDDLLAYAIDNLNRLEEFDSTDALQQVLERLNAQDQKKSKKSAPSDTLLEAWPEPEMLRQIVDRLNQWIRTQQAPADWQLDPLVATLPAPLADLPLVKSLDRMEFPRFDGYALQEAVWLRDAGSWARGDALDDLDRAGSLFDWTVRNMQLERESDGRIPLFPWESLLFGRGTATERAWVFVLLARQLGIDAAVLAVGDKASPRLWCVAVLIEGKAYLFDPLLGLPIPSPEGVKFDEAGQLIIQPATLAQVRADEKLLRQLDADAAHVYPIHAADLKYLAVMLEASPTYLSKRMKLLESRLAGSRKMVLSISPTAQAAQWNKVDGLDDARLWPWPFQTIERRAHLDSREVQAQLAAILPFYGMPSAPLRRGRVLQLKGKFIGDEGAIHYYQMARPSNAEVSASSAHPMEKLIYLRGKQDASYWLGLIAYQRAGYRSAIDYFANRTLLAMPNGPWSDGARYNLARTFEASGDKERAILQYASNADSAGYLGDLLRAKWLREKKDEKTSVRPQAERL
jgi:hypothetical protein